MRRAHLRLWTPVAMACVAAPVQATQYLTVEQAQRALFPQAERFEHEKAAPPRAWTAFKSNTVLGHVLVDEVIGKEQLITYAVGIGADGAVRGLEILDYREPRGGEVRDPRWRAQFLGKRRGSRLALDDDIQNISGATLSCRHITEGVRRLLETYEAAKK